MKIRVAQIKVQPEKGNLKANHFRLSGVLDELAKESPDVVVTPECFLDGYVATEKSVEAGDLPKYAIEPDTSPYAKGVSDFAVEKKTWFIYGCSCLVETGVANSALIYNRSGQLAGIYDKVHCQTHDQKFIPGQSLPVFDSDFGKFGVMICADRRWPETVRTLALKGARVIFNPTFGMSGELNLRMMQTRSFESEVFIVFTHPAQALITGPNGEVVRNETSEAVNFTVTEIDLSEVDQVRAGDSAHLRNRRPELYL